MDSNGKITDLQKQKIQQKGSSLPSGSLKKSEREEKSIGELKKNVKLIASLKKEEKKKKIEKNYWF